MKLEVDDFGKYLECTDIIEYDDRSIRDRTKLIIEDIPDRVDRIRMIFEWVRDTIPHSRDAGFNVVSCTASEVLREKTGVCYAKSHLLAAMLRSIGVPVGFCYQRLADSEYTSGFVLHGLNGVYIESLDKWILLDSRGNTGEIDAQFSLEQNQLAFPTDSNRGEILYNVIYYKPAAKIISVLQKFNSLEEMWPLLPDSL